MSTNPKANIDLHVNPRATQIADALRQLGKDVAATVTQNLDTCLSCERFDEKTEMCTLFQQRPPARVIAFGCPEYVPDIPF